MLSGGYQSRYGYYGLAGGQPHFPPPQQLMDTGVVVLPCLEPAELRAARQEFLQVVRTLPELRDDVPVDQIKPALGGFGALGLPSSFHHPFIRLLRQLVYVRVLPFFKTLLTHFPPGTKLEQIIDRVQLRQPGDSPSPESWHRDTCTIQPGCSCANGDHMFGGWLNLDEADQGFSCVLGTHTPGKNDGEGFATIRDKAKQQALSQRKTRVAVPPGHLIVFYANIVHEVLPTKRKYLSARMYCGWRLTQQQVPLFPPTPVPPGKRAQDLYTTLQKQDLVPLPSGQTPPMHARMHWVNHAERTLQPWSKNTIKPAYLIERTMATTGKTLTVVPQFLYQPDGVLYFPPYSPDEIKFHVPHIPTLTDAEAQRIEQMWQAALGGAGLPPTPPQSLSASSVPSFLPPPQQQQYICDSGTHTCQPYTGSSGSSTVIYPSLTACVRACKRGRDIINLAADEDDDVQYVQTKKR